MDLQNTIDSLKDDWSHLPARQVPAGRQIGHVPQIAKEAYALTIFDPLTELEVETLQEETGLSYPKPFFDFLLHFNGLMLFAGEIAIYGRRQGFDRESLSRIQPFSIVTPNTIERLPHAEPPDLFIGFFREDGSEICMNEDGAIKRISRDEPTVITTWSSLDRFFETEVIKRNSAALATLTSES
jgi:hypothetical protein